MPTTGSSQPRRKRSLQRSRDKEAEQADPCTGLVIHHYALALRDTTQGIPPSPCPQTAPASPQPLRMDPHTEPECSCRCQSQDRLFCPSKGDPSHPPCPGPPGTATLHLGHTPAPHGILQHRLVVGEAKGSPLLPTPRAPQFLEKGK